MKVLTPKISVMSVLQTLSTISLSSHPHITSLTLYFSLCLSLIPPFRFQFLSVPSSFSLFPLPHPLLLKLLSIFLSLLISFSTNLSLSLPPTSLSLSFLLFFSFCLSHSLTLPLFFSFHDLPALSRVWQHVKFSDVSLKTRPRYSLMVNEDVKKRNKHSPSPPPQKKNKK